MPAWRSLSRLRPELLFLLLVAGVLNLWGLAENGWANEYYSAAVRSMSSSWHAFLYGSFDASGAMTVDKPPLALWVQVASVKVFGFHPLSMLVPQALMGVATVALVYDLTRRLWGRPAGFVAGLALATTPIAVAISRHNNPDALLILCCAGALWATVRALQDGRTRWLVLAGVCVGLGFEAKMAAALLVVPGIVAAWLWVAPRGRLSALRQLLAGGAAMVAVGGAWPLLVALTPAADRPWVSGTSDNSILSLIFGYNGLGRLSGQAGGPQAFGGGGGGGAGPFGGSPGVLRLLDASLGGQAGWLLGFALVAGIGIAILSRLRRADQRSGWLIAVGGAALTCAVAFSAASGIFHPYYVSQLAPFAAALVGAGVGQALKGGWSGRTLAALAVAGGVATTLAVLHNNPGQLQWLPPVLVTAGVLASARSRCSAGATSRRASPSASPCCSSRPPRGRARRSGTPPTGRSRRAGRAAWPPAASAGPAASPAGARVARARASAARPARAPERRRPAPPRPRTARRRRPRRRRQPVDHRGAGLHQDARRRHARGLEPERRRRDLDHRLRRRRRRDRRLLRPREPGHRELAGRPRAVRRDPLGPHDRRRRAWKRQPRRQQRRHGRRGRQRPRGELGQRPLRRRRYGTGAAVMSVRGLTGERRRRLGEE